MKKFFLSLVLTGLASLVFMLPAEAQQSNNSASSYSWQPTGSPGFSANSAFFITVATNSSGQPYICYADTPWPAAVNVLTYTNSGWTQVGQAGFAVGLDVTMAVDLLGNPQVAMTQYHQPMINQASALAFDGVDFVYTGNQYFSAGDTYHTSIAIGNDNHPYVAYQDAANQNKLSVMTYTLNSWQYVGAAAFSPGFSRNPVIAFSPLGVAYVAFGDAANSFKASVMKYDGLSWVYAGNAGFSAGIMDSISLAFDPSGKPYVAFSDGANSWKATVMKLDGNQWVNVGQEGFSAGAAGWTSLVFNSQGNPVVGYRDAGNGNKATVMAFEGGQWVNVGTAGFSAGEVTWVSMASSPDGKLYIAFSDAANSDRTTVMEFAGYVGITETSGTSLSLYPNPVTDILGVRFSRSGIHGANIQILDSGGKIIRSLIINENDYQLNVSDLSAGIYCIQIQASGQSFCRKFIKK